MSEICWTLGETEFLQITRSWAWRICAFVVAFFGTPRNDVFIKRNFFSPVSLVCEADALVNNLAVQGLEIP